MSNLPQYLGRVVLGGGGPGCPCEQGAFTYRIVRAVKAHHGWPGYSTEATSHRQYLRLTPRGSRLSSYGGARVIDRLTGRSTGSPLITPIDISFRAPAGSWATINTTDPFTYEPDGSGIDLSGEYTLGELQGDVDAMLGDVAHHPVLLPDFGTIRIRRLETASRPQYASDVSSAASPENLWTPLQRFNRPTLTGAIVSGVEGDTFELEHPLRAKRYTPETRTLILRSVFRRGTDYMRERAIVRISGPYSTQVRRMVDLPGWLAGGLVSVEPVEYWTHRGGWLDIYSPHIGAGQAFAGAQHPSEVENWTPVSAWVDIRVGDRPTAGEPVRETIGFGGGGGGAGC